MGHLLYRKIPAKNRDLFLKLFFTVLNTAIRHKYNFSMKTENLCIVWLNMFVFTPTISNLMLYAFIRNELTINDSISHFPLLCKNK